MWIMSVFVKFLVLTFVFYLSRDSVWSCLTGRMFDGTPSVVVHDVREIETWILRLLSAPVPVPGKTRVQVSN